MVDEPATYPSDSASAHGRGAERPEDEADHVPTPIEAVRSDVSRVASFLRSIHSRYLWGGLLLYAIASVAGVILAAVAPARDWFMHLAMYVAILVFVLLYVRAYLLRRRVSRAFYALASVALLAFFAWVLIDLVAARLEVTDGDVTRPDGTVVPGPSVVERPRAPGFFVPATLLGLSALWLALHWLVISRFGRGGGDHGRAALS